LEFFKELSEVGREVLIGMLAFSPEVLIDMLSFNPDKRLTAAEDSSTSGQTSPL
jgi:hypothetical protein